MVERYDQPALPSPVVGTPGVDPSAGVAAGEVASLAAKSTAQQGAYAGQMIQQGGQELNHIISGVGSIIGKHVMQARANEKALDTKLQGQAVTMAARGYANESDQVLEGGKLAHAGAPETFEAPLQDTLRSNLEARISVLQDSKYGKDPAFIGAARDAMEGIFNSSMSNGRSWAATQQILQAHAAPEQIRLDVENRVANAQGTPEEKNQAYADSTTKAIQDITKMTPQLGAANVQRAIAATVMSASEARIKNEFNSLETATPVDKVNGLVRLEGMINESKQGLALGPQGPPGSERPRVPFMLNADYQEKASKLVGTMREQGSADLANHYAVQTGWSKFGTNQTEGLGRVYRLNATVQQNIIDKGQQSLRDIAAGLQTALGNPNFSEKDKAAALAHAESASSAVNSMISSAQENLKHRQIILDQGAEAAAAIQIENDKATKAKAVAQIKMGKLDAGIAFNKMRVNFIQLGADPQHNADQLGKLGHQMMGFIDQKVAAGYMTPTTGGNHQAAIMKAIEGAAVWQRTVPNEAQGPLDAIRSSLQGALGIQPTEKAATGTAAQALQTKALQDMMSGIKDIADLHKTDQQNNALGLSDAQQNFVNSQMKAIPTTFTEVQRAGVLARIQANAIQKFPTAETVDAATAQESAGKFAKDEMLKGRIERARELDNAPSPTEEELSRMQGKPAQAPLETYPADQYHHESTSDYPSTKGYPGVIKGNIDLSHGHPIIDYPHGLNDTNSTPMGRKDFPHYADDPRTRGGEYSMSFTEGKTLVSIPTIFDGKLHGYAEAKQRYKDTGQFLIKAPTSASVAFNKYEDVLHSRPVKVNGEVYEGIVTKTSAPGQAKGKPSKGGLIPPPPVMPPGVSAVEGGQDIIILNGKKYRAMD